jgi:kynurenine 3-monooxygenase
MNAGFEDVSLFSKALESGRDWEAIFAEFDSRRKADADAIADMAVENFIEMRDKVGDPKFQLAKQVEKILEKEFPEDYWSRYRLVTFTRRPYSFARRVGEVDDEVLAELCSGIQRADQVDLERARKLVKSKLSPLLNT